MGHKDSLVILPPNMQHFFNKIQNIHHYNTRTKTNFYTTNRDRNKGNIIRNIILNYNNIPFILKHRRNDTSFVLDIGFLLDMGDINFPNVK
jgi:hypothetical protein